MTLFDRNSDAAVFFRSWLSKPFQVASLAPSSLHLAEAITADIQCGGGKILELGPGTGVFTNALLRRGIREEELILIENNPVFAQLLRSRYPRASLYEQDARSYALNEQEPITTAVSGLPLLSIPEDHVGEILQMVFSHLDIKGALYQFTYGPKCPAPRRILDRLKLKAEFRRFVFRNLPPASVYCITRC